MREAIKALIGGKGEGHLRMNGDFGDSWRKGASGGRSVKKNNKKTGGGKKDPPSDRALLSIPTLKFWVS